MDDKTLKKANEIAQMIRENKSALCCFEWEEEYGGGSRNPQLIIEFDDSDGREQQKIPMVHLHSVLDRLVQIQVSKIRPLKLQKELNRA